MSSKDNITLNSKAGDIYLDFVWHVNKLHGEGMQMILIKCHENAEVNVIKVNETYKQSF